MYQAELFVDAKCTLAEGPCWDPFKKRLLWVDIMESKIHSYHFDDQSQQSIDVGQYVGAVVVDKQGDYIIAARDGFFRLDAQTEEMIPIGDPEADRPDNRFNDGKCDPAGRFWAGTMSLIGKREAGSLYCLEPDGSFRTMISGVSTSNGLAWSPDRKRMYYIDTPTKKVMAYDYDLQTGEISRPRVAVQIPDGEGGPDGMTIDTEGMLWVAQWGGYKVSRWNPENGERLSSISIPAAHVTSCVFGGDHLDQLYITTARQGLSEEQVKEQPLAGGIFVVQTDVKGFPSDTFGK